MHYDNLDMLMTRALALLIRSLSRFRTAVLSIAALILYCACFLLFALPFLLPTQDEV